MFDTALVKSFESLGLVKSRYDLVDFSLVWYNWQNQYRKLYLPDNRNIKDEFFILANASFRIQFEIL